MVAAVENRMNFRRLTWVGMEEFSSLKVVILQKSLLAAARRRVLECECDDVLANVIVVVRRGRDPTMGGDRGMAVIRCEMITATNNIMTVFTPGFIDGIQIR